MENIINIILSDMANDSLKLHHKLEGIINSKEDINSILVKTKATLAEIVINEQSIKKLMDSLPPTELTPHPETAKQEPHDIH
jgi:hypothetical protein